MPDIRQRTTILDDFNRTENPLSQGGNWTRPGVASYDVKTNGSEAVGSLTGGQSCHALYLPITMSGNDCEVWCQRMAGNSPSLAWGLGFYDGTGASANGWLFRSETDTIGGRFRIYKLTSGSFTSVAEVTPGVSDGGAHLIRRNGNDIEGWAVDGGAMSDLGLVISHTDSAYSTGMYPVLEISGSTLHAWDNFGAGGRRMRSQFIRRPLG